MNMTVYQQVYVSADKTKVLVILVDGEGSVIDRRFFTYDAYPLAKVAREAFEHVTKVLRRCFDADTIDYHCNVLGRYQLTKQERGYDRQLLESRLIGKKSVNKVSWVEPAEENTEESVE